MSSKTFATISREECLSVYKKILTHSDVKWESGKKLAEMNDAGGAVSLAIISVEELIKAIIIFLDGNGFEFRNVKGMNAFFEQHQIRYILAYAMFAMSLFGEDLLKFIDKVHTNPNEILELNRERKENKSAFDRRIKHYTVKKMVLLKKEFEWFSKIDIFRQDGFYSDYENQLKNPIEINAKDYNEVALRLEKVRMIGKKIIEAFDSADAQIVEQLEKMKNDLKEKKHYEKLGETLLNIRKYKGNPFQLINTIL